MPKKKSLKKLVTSTILATTIMAGSSGWYLGSSKNQIPVPYYEVEKVLDGDTFVTKEDQIIRLTSIEAPEYNLCGGSEAKKELESLILNQPLYIKVLFRDQFNRLVSLVYTKNKFVNLEMVASGKATYRASAGKPPLEIKLAGQNARERKLGVYGSCIQDSNLDNPKCLIKANNNRGKYYRFPGCGQYDNTQVETYLGDEWFCTEAAAQKAGYTKGTDCFSQTFSPQP